MKLRFSIRDLLWLTLVAALLTAWWIQYAKFRSTNQALTNQLTNYAQRLSEEESRSKRREARLGALQESLEVAIESKLRSIEQK